MKPWLQDADVTLYHGDVLQVLRELPADSVDCCVTSPPYWGLRDYGTGAWEGGDEGCDHVPPPTRYSPTSTLKNDGRPNPGANNYEKHTDTPYRDTCGKCGATRIDQQLGLEPTPEEYVTRMVEVFREVRRVLAAHGTVWLNLGDSYTSTAPGTMSPPDEKFGTNAAARQIMRPFSGLKPKDLVGIPWRVAFALQADGWYLRSDIIWAKPNPMPESVTDRPTKAHEYVFLLSKQPRYFFDQEAVRESYEPSTLDRNAYARTKHVRQSDGSSGGASYLSTKAGGERVFIGPTKEESWTEPSDTSALFVSDSGTSENNGTTTPRSGSSQTSPTASAGPVLPQTTTSTLHPSLPPEAPRGPDGRRQTRVTAGEFSEQHRDGERWPNGGRNIRSVWEIATQPYADAHFATFPEELARRCIAAGCPEQVCRVCGKARERVVENSYSKTSPNPNSHSGGVGPALGTHRPTNPEESKLPKLFKSVETLGFTDCGHDDYRTGVTLDPFIGSGTVAYVARKLGRHAVGIDLNESYLELAARRLQQQSLFAGAA